MEPTAKDVEVVHKWGIPQFSDWFWNGFQDSASRDPSRLQYAFRPLHLVVSLQDSLGELEAVYDALGDEGSDQRSEAQKNFCGGLAGAFLECAKEHHSSGLSSIFSLAQRIKARELIKHIEPMLKGTEKPQGDDPLLRPAMDYLVTVAKKPDPEVKSVIEALVRSDHFDPKLYAYAFTTLCVCAPDAWLQHLALLRPHAEKGSTDNLNFTAKKFVSRVPLERIAQGIMYLNLGHRADRFLLAALVSSDDAPLVVSQGGSGEALMLSRREGDQTQVAINSAIYNPEVERVLRQALQRVDLTAQGSDPTRSQPLPQGRAGLPTTQP